MKLSAAILSALSAQYSHELQNHLIYRHLASWAEFLGLTGSASFLRKQAAGELEHAEKVIAYIEARNENPTPIGVIADYAPPANLIAAFERVQEIELATSVALYGIKELAESEGDAMTCQWLMDPSGLIREQVEEENVAQTILDRMKQRMIVTGLDGAAIHDLDLWIGSL